MQVQLEKEVWGEVQSVEEEAAGVLYVETAMPDLCGKELYVVTPEAIPKIISEETLRYGTVVQGGYVFELYADGNGWELVSYELDRYRLRKAPSEEGREGIYTSSVYAAEKYPAYFGGILPPRSTPWGLVLRYKKVAEGIFFLETDRLEWVLAVAEPIWGVDLSEEARGLGQLWEGDRLLRRREAQYLYFQTSRCGPVIYELLDYEEYQTLLSYIPSKAALETKLYLNHPGYTLRHNFVQMSGQGKSDLLNRLASTLGAWDLVEEHSSALDERRMRCCIQYSPELAHEPMLLLPY